MSSGRSSGPAGGAPSPAFAWERGRPSHMQSSVGGVTREQYEYGGIGAQVGAGIEVAVWRGLHVLGEYKFTATDARISVDGGEAVIPARSHHVVAGMAARF